MTDEQAAQIAQVELAVKSLMTREAITRYNTVKLAHPDKALRVLGLIVQLAQKGTRTIDDETLKQLLGKLEQKRETKINFR